MVGGVIQGGRNVTKNSSQAIFVPNYFGALILFVCLLRPIILGTCFAEWFSFAFFFFFFFFFFFVRISVTFHLTCVHILNKKKEESLHFVDGKLPNLTQKYFFKKYVHMKAARLTKKKTYAKVSKLIRRK